MGKCKSHFNRWDSHCDWTLSLTHLWWIQTPRRRYHLTSVLKQFMLANEWCVVQEWNSEIQSPLCLACNNLPRMWTPRAVANGDFPLSVSVKSTCPNSMLASICYPWISWYHLHHQAICPIGQHAHYMIFLPSSSVVNNSMESIGSRVSLELGIVLYKYCTACMWPGKAKSPLWEWASVFWDCCPSPWSRSPRSPGRVESPADPPCCGEVASASQ